MIRGLSVALAACLFLGACDTMSGWVGENEDPPLPGKRISVLSRDSNLKPDPGAAAIKLPPPQANEEWDQAGGISNHAMHHMMLTGPLEKEWSRDIGTGSSKRARLLAQPIIANGRVFALDAEANVSALDARTGKVYWETDVTPDGEDNTHSGGGVAYEDGKIFVSTGFAHVVALDAETGKEVWRQKLSGPMRGAPTVRAGRVYVVTVDNQTHALAADDGSTLWTHQGMVEGASILAGSSPAVDGNVVVVPYSSGEVYALRAENGAVLWQDQLSTIRRTDNIARMADIRGRPVVDRGRVYAVSHADLLVAIDMRSGRRIWEREIGSVQTPWVVGEYLYVVSNNNEVLALEATTGRIIWKTELRQWMNADDREGRIVWAGPIVASDRVILGNNAGELMTLSPYTGQIMGRMKLSDGISIQPVVALDTLFVLTDDADLIAIK